MSEATQIVLTAAVVAVILASVAAVVMMRRARRSEVPGRPVSAPEEVTITLEVAAGDAREPRVRRLVDQAADRIFRAMPSVQVVEVRSMTGALLGRPVRGGPAPREIAIPDFLHEPHVRRRTASIPEGGVEREGAGSVGAVMGRSAFAQGAVSRERAPIADRFDLPPEVNARLRQRDDAVELVRAILDEAGLAPSVDDDVVLVADRAIVVVPEAGFGTSASGLLNHAFVRFRASGARSGFVISLGFMDPTEVRRRELFEPALIHLGPEALQRMADAVALGADPLRFAQAPAFAMPAVAGGTERAPRRQAHGGEDR